MIHAEQLIEHVIKHLAFSFGRKFNSRHGFNYPSLGKPYDIHSNMTLCFPMDRSLGIQDELNAELALPLWLDVHHYVVHWKCHETYT
jgi:UV DNA damage repair endonuclease